MKGPQGRINRAVWGPLNKTIISAGEDAVIRIWDVEVRWCVSVSWKNVLSMCQVQQIIWPIALILYVIFFNSLVIYQVGLVFALLTSPICLVVSAVFFLKFKLDLQ